MRQIDFIQEVTGLCWQHAVRGDDNTQQTTMKIKDILMEDSKDLFLSDREGPLLCPQQARLQAPPLSGCPLPTKPYYLFVH